MARYQHIPGIASIVHVDDDREIDALLDRTDLDRTYAVKGPLLNRLTILRLRRALFRDGHALLSFAPRENSDRAAAQSALAKRLDAMIESPPWDNTAIAAMATYVTTGAGRDAAHAALTYATAYPFLPPGDTSYEAAKFSRLFGLFQIMQAARMPWKRLSSRLMGKDKRAAQEILQATGGDDYGLHAVGVTLANSLVILERLRAVLAQPSTANTNAAFEWNQIRTSPVAVTRQNKVACRMPGIEQEVPANSLIVMKLRQAQRSESPDGFEFASAHWSFCPASRYIEAIFARVYEFAKRSQTSA